MDITFLYTVQSGVSRRLIAIHPERFVTHPPKPQELQKEVWINKPQSSQENTH